MTTYDLDRMLGEWMDAAEPMSEPQALLPPVFAVTRELPQRRGLTGRLAVAVRSGPAVFQWDARPLLTYAILILLLLSMTFAVAFASGLLQTPFPTGWRSLDADPPPAPLVTDIASTSSGFVAVGTSAATDLNCVGAPNPGLIWTSRDGNAWEDQSDPSLIRMQPQYVISSGDMTYVFGANMSCGVGSDRSGGAWRSRDGLTWESVPRSEIFQYGNVPLMVDLDGTLVAVGMFLPQSGDAEYGPPETRVWSSRDGATWTHLTTLDGLYVGSLAEKDGILVGLGGDDNEPGFVVLRSVDGGRTWDEQSVPDDVPDTLATVVSGNGRFVAAGDGAAVSSSDGETWVPATIEPSDLEGFTGLWALPHGYLVSALGRSDGQQGRECYAVGSVAYPLSTPYESAAPLPTLDLTAPQGLAPSPVPQPTDICNPVLGDGGTWISADGIEWRRGADLPMATAAVGPTNRYVVAASESALVTSDTSHEAQIWYSPLDRFAP